MVLQKFLYAWDPRLPVFGIKLPEEAGLSARSGATLIDLSAMMGTRFSIDPLHERGRAFIPFALRRPFDLLPCGDLTQWTGTRLAPKNMRPLYALEHKLILVNGSRLKGE
jgi:hypothetical protein